MWCKLLFLYATYLLSAGAVYTRSSEEGYRKIDYLERIRKHCGNISYFEPDYNPFLPLLPKLHLAGDKFYFTIGELPGNITAVDWYVLIKPKKEWNVNHRGSFDRLSNNTWLGVNDLVTWKPMQQMIGWFVYTVHMPWGLIEEVDEVIVYNRKRKYIYEDIRSRGPPGGPVWAPIHNLPLDLPMPGYTSFSTTKAFKIRRNRNTTRQKNQLKNNSTKRRTKLNSKTPGDKTNFN